MGTGSGVIFKGSGFYLTDYKKESPTKTPAKGKEDKPSSGPDPKGKTDPPKSE
jgi:predicted nucleic acid-binding Zn ribbon protein